VSKGVRPKTLGHLSDLHLGRSDSTSRAAIALCEAVLRADLDHVVVTGDVTHRGRSSELALFHRIFEPLLAARRLTVVPGNHDRLGDDLGRRIMGTDQRVDVVRADGIALVRVDSTGAHNRFLLTGHGSIRDAQLAEIDAALAAIPAGILRVVLLHHHVLPLPEETLPERIATSLGWPFATELARGLELVARVQAHCDLILHGHRHVPRATEGGASAFGRLGIYNAGASTSLGRVRVFAHHGGALLGPPEWLCAKEATDVDLGEHRAVLGGRLRFPAAPRAARLAPAASS
jgi:3',5'-cyclic AMP phosphodiesterase CpdA